MRFEDHPCCFNSRDLVEIFLAQSAKYHCICESSEPDQIAHKAGACERMAEPLPQGAL